MLLALSHCGVQLVSEIDLIGRTMGVGLAAQTSEGGYALTQKTIQVNIADPCSSIVDQLAFDRKTSAEAKLLYLWTAMSTDRGLL